MAQIVLSVGSAAGRAFALPQAAVDSIPKDIVASGNSYVVELYPDTEFAAIARLISITGFTAVDATHNITVRAVDGGSSRDHANVMTNPLRYDATKGVALKMTCNYEYMIFSDAPYTVIEGLQLLGTNYTANPIFLTGANSIVRNCIAEANPRGSASDYVVRLDGETSLAENNVIINRQGGSHGLKVANVSAAKNNTIVTPSDAGAGGAGITTITGENAPHNNAIFGFGTAVSIFTGTLASDGHNATDLATIEGGMTGNLVSLVYADQFVNTTSAALDLRLSAGSALRDSGSAGGTTASINKLTRPSGTGYDIGAFEYQGPIIAPGAPTDVTASPAGSGAASISFTPPVQDGGSVVLDYTFTSSPGDLTATGTTSPVAFPGLTNGVAYTFTGKARNSAGSSIASAPSNSVTPAIPPSGAITSQPPPDGQSQRFVGTTANATSGTYTLTGSNGGVTVGPTAFTITANAFDFTVAGLEPGNYAVTLTVAGPGGTAGVSGTSAFAIMGVGGGGEVIPGGDTTNPTVSLAASSTNITAAGSFTLTATAADNVGVDHVEFYRGTTLIGTDTGSPFTASETVAYADNGSRSYTAKAYDAAGNVTTSSPVVVTINIAAPVSPAPTVAIADAVMVGDRLEASGTVNLQGDGSGTLQAYLDPQPSGSALGPFAITVNAGTWTYSRALNPGKVKLRTVATANGQTATALSGERTMLGLTGSKTLPTV